MLVIIMRSVSFPFYRSKAWKDCRAAYIHSVNGLCERCLEKGIIKAADIVHHIIELDDEKARDPSIAFNFDNLQAVCIECHNEVHFGKKTERRYIISEDGRVILKSPPSSKI